MVSKISLDKIYLEFDKIYYFKLKGALWDIILNNLLQKHKKLNT